MTLITRNFGEIEIDENDVLDFGYGILGFPHDRRYVLLAMPEDFGAGPIYFLQSVDDGDISFVLVDMTAFSSDYSPLVDDIYMEALGAPDPEDLCIYNVATVHEELEKSTVNLKAPVVINTANKRGLQIVCTNEEYSVKAPLLVSPDKVGEIC